MKLISHSVDEAMGCPLTGIRWTVNLAIRLAGLALWLVFWSSAHQATAEMPAWDDCSRYTHWKNGDNEGHGFGPWTLLPTRGDDENFSGFFLSTPWDQIASPNGNVWGLYAHGRSGTNVATAFRPIAKSLAPGEVFAIKWQNTGIGITPVNVAGLYLRHGDVHDSARDFDAGARFGLIYRGGGNDSYQIVDGSGTNEAGLKFAGNPFQVRFTLLTPDRYRLDVLNAAGETSLLGRTNILASAGSIDSFSLFALETAGDQLFNGAEVYPTTSAPPQIANVYPPDGASYVFFTNKISFDVSSPFSTLPANGIVVQVNGVRQNLLSVSHRRQR